MTTSRLREIPFLHKEIDYLDIDIAKLDETPESTEAVQQLRELLLARRERCITALATAEAFLESIPDEMTWLIFMLRFSEGLSWAEVARTLTGAGRGKLTAENARKRCYRYLERLERDDENSHYL